MSQRHCQRCGAFTTGGPFCGRCSELREEQEARRIAEEAVKRLESEVALQRRYTVHTDTQWSNLTWNEAVKKANEIYGFGVRFSHITDETGKTIRTWKHEGEKKVIA